MNISSYQYTLLDTLITDKMSEFRSLNGKIQLKIAALENQFIYNEGQLDALQELLIELGITNA